MSPCIGICEMDESSGYCLGCGRTLAEISGWGTASVAQQQQTLTQLPARQSALGADADDTAAP